VGPMSPMPPLLDCGVGDKPVEGLGDGLRLISVFFITPRAAAPTVTRHALSSKMRR
jgi:hypothetical protein